MGAHRRICGSNAMVGSSIIAADFLLAFEISKQCFYDKYHRSRVWYHLPAIGIFEQCTYDEQCTIAAELEIYLG